MHSPPLAGEPVFPEAALRRGAGHFLSATWPCMQRPAPAGTRTRFSYELVRGPGRWDLDAKWFPKNVLRRVVGTPFAMAMLVPEIPWTLDLSLPRKANAADPAATWILLREPQDLLQKMKRRLRSQAHRLPRNRLLQAHA